MINVGLEVSSTLTSNPTGIQRYMSGVISGLAAQEDVSLTRLLKVSRFRKRRFMPESAVPYRWYGLTSFGKRDNIHLIHCLDTTLPKRTGGTPVVATIHDLYLALHAEYLDAKTIRRKRQKIVDVCKKSAHIVVPTDAIRYELMGAFEIGAPISTIPHGIESKFIERPPEAIGRDKRGRNYILGFSGGKRKNFPLLAEAFYRSEAYKMGWCLNIVGKPSEDELRYVLGFLPNERLNIYQQLSDEELISLYSNAGSICYPSHYEGFGFPVLEGMAAGVPVVTSAHGATEEIAYGYAYLVDPHSAESIKNGLNKAITMSVEEVEGAKAHATSYTWSKVGAKLKEVYMSVLNSEPRVRGSGSIDWIRDRKN